MFKYQIYSVGSGGCGLLLLQNLNDFNRPQLVEQIDCNDQSLKIKFSGLIGLIKKQEILYLYGQFTQIISVPKQIDTIKKVIKFACGWQHGLILTDDGLYGLGSNKFYEFGYQEKNIYEQPKKLQFYCDEIFDISCGFRQSFIIRKQDIFVVGQNKNNELNVPDKKVIEQFTKFNISGVKKIKCGQKFTLLQKFDDSLWGWGCNNFGQLAQEPKLQIVQETLLFKAVKSFDCGWSHHIILTQDYKIFICGRGDLGQQGDGYKMNNFNYKEIKIIGTQVKCGSETSLILNEDNHILYVTGWNEHGNLGLGHNQNIYSFENLEKIQNVKAKGASMLLYI